MSIYDFEVQNIRGDTVKLEDYRGKVLLITNTASQCGFTPQLEGLEALHSAYQARGLVVLGFPLSWKQPGASSTLGSGMGFPCGSGRSESRNPGQLGSRGGCPRPWRSAAWTPGSYARPWG